MTTTNTTSCDVSIRPTRNFLNKIRKTAGLGRCRNLFNDDIIYTTLNDCNMDQTETCRRLKMIQDIRVDVDIKYSFDDVYTMLKECNMDPSEATQRLLYIDTFQEVKKKKDSIASCYGCGSKNHFIVDCLKAWKKKAFFGGSWSSWSGSEDGSVSNGDTVQKVEKKKDKQKNVSNGDTVQEVEQKKDMQQKSVSNGVTVQEVEQKKDTQQKTVGKVDNQWRAASRSSKDYNDAGRRSLTSGKEYGVTNNHVKKVWRPVDTRKESNGAHMATSAAYVNGKLAISNGSQSHNLVPKLSSVTVSKNTTASAINTHSASNDLKLSSPCS